MSRSQIVIVVVSIAVIAAMLIYFQPWRSFTPDADKREPRDMLPVP